MKFTCTRENLAYALDLVSGITTKQNNLPILSHVLLRAEESGVEVISTNLETVVRAHLRAKVDSVGTFTIPGKMFTDFVHLLSDEQVTLELVGNELKINCGGSSTKIKGSPADEYPVIPEMEEITAYAVNVLEFHDSLAKVLFATSKAEVRPELSGVCFQFGQQGKPSLVLAATDSYRLAEKTLTLLQGSEEYRCIVPGRVVAEFIRLLTLGKGKGDGEHQVRLLIGKNNITLRYDQFEIMSRLIDGSYPDYRQIIPNQFKTTAVLPTFLLIKSIKTASIFSSTGVNAIQMEVQASENRVKVYSTSSQSGEHESFVDGVITGEENKTVLNFRYVLDGINQLEGDEVEFLMNSADAPCMFKTKGKDDYLYLVMPIRQ